MMKCPYCGGELEMKLKTPTKIVWRCVKCWREITKS